MKKLLRILAIALCIVMLMSCTVYAAAVPSDVANNAPLKKAVSALMDAGAITGDIDGLYHPEQNLTRAQVCAIIVRLVDADGEETLVEPFSDLKGYEWAAPFIKYANIHGITNGYGDGTFAPGSNVKFSELAAFAVQAAGYSNVSGTWPSNYIEKAKSLGFLDGVTIPKDVNGYATKADAAMVIYNAMDEIKSPAVGKQYVSRSDWDPTVKKAINDFIAAYGKDSPNHKGNEYAVFDFDDTCAIYDVAVAERYWRLQTMQFQFTPEELPMLLDACFGNAAVERPASANYADDKQPHSYQDWYDDILTAYDYLWETYGPFTYKGVDAETQKTMNADPYWSEFAVKFQVVFKVANSSEGDYPTYPWYKYWNYNMTEDEAYYVSKTAFEAQKDLPTKSVKWSTSDTISSKVGTVTTSWTEGVSVAANMTELWKALDANDIDVWICSASGTTQIRAAVDVLGGGHNAVTGIIAYSADYQDAQPTPDSKIGPEKAWSTWYDWDGGTAWVTTNNYSLYNGWDRAGIPIHSDAVQMGKVTAINNALVSQYSRGPVAAFGDSAGDFEMMSMYQSLKLVMVSNAGKSVTSFHLGNVALYQKEVLGWNLAEANAAGETLYVLQGRDLNGTRSFIAGDELIGLGKTSGTATPDDAKTALELEWMKTQGTDIGACIDVLCIKTSADAANNPIGIQYGYRNYYGGYHSLQFAENLYK